ncbi:hypothetical protein GTP45_09755 [Pseudoduganella sp. FT55W]|uniref:Uncharacterized protein n=1 Tax=Duganella rivi TaxID=2666083 RepID=A0A7X4GPB7_9BURK|nr:DUF5908 family protein [Duganella rivi]MYM67113.1 hypothetical protein [Duganella rivi]
MSIEIRELVIKTTIVERAASDSGEPAATPALKEEILSACRQMILNLLRERGER